MRRTKIVFLIWILLFLLIYFRNGSPAAAMAVLFAVLYIILAFIASRVTGKNLEVNVRGGGLAEKDDAMTATILLANTGRLPVFLAECEVKVQNMLTGEIQQKDMAVSLWPKQSRTETIEIREKYCGRVDVTVDDMWIYDPLKLFCRYREAAGADMGYVAPAITTFDIPPAYLDSYDMESYRYSQFEKGSDTGEVFGVREYQDGDSPKQIHWKLSAKMDELVVKIPSYPIENNILLLLDNVLAPRSELSPEKKSKLMEYFWSLSASLLEKGIPHSAGWYDAEGESFRLKAIRNRDEMWDAVPESLSCGFRNGKESTVYRYLEIMEDGGFSNHFLVTAQEARDAERLENYGAVKVFRESE